jgi:hypothetical protein
MVFTDRIKNTFASSVKEDSTIKLVPYFIIHITIEDMVLGNVSVLCTLAWLFNKRDIA